MMNNLEIIAQLMKGRNPQEVATQLIQNQKIKDGVIYDTFDPSERYLWCAYYVGEENNK